MRPRDGVGERRADAGGDLGCSAGRLVAVVTTLEMRQLAGLRGAVPDDSELARHSAMPLAAYRDLYRGIGQDWLWWSRLAVADADLAAIIHDPAVEIWVATVAGAPAGLVELDFRVPGQCELAFFGVTRRWIGTRVGRWLMDRVIAIAWAKPIARLWVHTCTLDHPAALPFYRRSGFVAMRQQVEIDDDPRVTGLLPRDAAPQVPIISEATNGR